MNNRLLKIMDTLAELIGTTKERKCECYRCTVEYPMFKRIEEKLDKEENKFLDDYILKSMTADMDVWYYKEHLEGTYPTSTLEEIEAQNAKRIENWHAMMKEKHE